MKVASHLEKTSVLNAISIVIGALALSACIGFSFQNQALRIIGQASGFSPMPLPFRELVPGAEIISMDFSLTLKRDGQERSMTDDEVVEYFALKGRPHRAAIPFYTIAAYFAVVPHPIKEKAFQYVCRNLGADELTAHALYAQQKYHYHIVCRQ